MVVYPCSSQVSEVPPLKWGIFNPNAASTSSSSQTTILPSNSFAGVTVGLIVGVVVVGLVVGIDVVGLFVGLFEGLVVGLVEGESLMQPLTIQYVVWP